MFTVHLRSFSAINSRMFDKSNGLDAFIQQDMNGILLVFEACLLAKEIHSFDPRSGLACAHCAHKAARAKMSLPRWLTSTDRI